MAMMPSRKVWIGIAVVIVGVLVLFWVAQRAVADDPPDEGTITSPNDPGWADAPVDPNTKIADINDTDYNYDAGLFSPPEDTPTVVRTGTMDGGNDGITYLGTDPDAVQDKWRICSTARWVAWHNGYLGNRFATFHFNQHYCFGRSSGHWRVFSVGKPNVSCDTSGIAEAVGWSCDGINDSYGHFMRWRGDWHGGHVSARKYRLHGCGPEPLGCIEINSYTMPMRLVLHGDGSQKFGLKF